MRERRSNDGMAGTLHTATARADEVMDQAMDQVVGGVVDEAVVRAGMRVRVVPDDMVPAGVPFADEPFDDAWYADAVRGWVTDQRAGQEPQSETGTGIGTGPVPEPDSGLGFPPGWPPDAVPVFLWPQETLQQALTGAPGPWLARVVAEAIDLAGHLDPGHLDPGRLDGGRDLHADADLDAGAGVLGGLSDDTLGDLMVACGRLQSWAAGIQARVVAERAGRESHPLAHSSLVGQVMGELVVTDPEATEVVVRAESGTQHPTVIDALVAGRIDARKAHVLLRSASQLTVTERAEAIERYLPRASRRTWKWLQRKMLAFAKDRHGAAKTAKAAAQHRSVQVDRAEDDMGWLSAYLPAVDAAAVWGVVDDMAHQLRHTTGEDRTLGQLRADSLTGIITGRLLPADRHTHTDTGTGTTGEADKATETSGPGATGGPGADPGTGIAGEPDSRVDRPIENPVDSTNDNDNTNDNTNDDGNRPVCTCGGRAPVQVVQHVVQEIVRPVRVTPTRPVVRVTIPATALLGLDDAPGHLAGFGPIPAETARTIAQDATWQRLLTDPTTGILTDYSTTTYQPGKVLRAAIEARDDTCTFGWCDTPGSHCDLDHIEPFDHDHKHNHDHNDTGTGTGNAPGQTRAQNLQPLCRKHHLLKTHAGWDVVRDPDTGITIWTTPTGRTHTRPPTVLDTHIDLDHIDPDTSHDLTLRALTGQHLPSAYATTEPGAIPPTPNEPDRPTETDDPPF